MEMPTGTARRRKERPPAGSRGRLCGCAVRADAPRSPDALISLNDALISLNACLKVAQS
jgi:hypothetical protein